MLTCILCPNTKGLARDIAKQVKNLSLKAVRGHRKKPRDPKEANGVDANGGGEEEWVAEPEPGVLLTLSVLGNGFNRLKKIRFSEECFDASEAQKWWGENYDKIMELYTIQQESRPATPPQSDDEAEANPTEARDDAGSSSPACLESNNTAVVEEEGENKITECVVEDEPGVFVTVRTLLDGSKELLRVELSRERFGEVKARVWWEENKARLHTQYS